MNPKNLETSAICALHTENNLLDDRTNNEPVGLRKRNWRN